MSAGVHSWEVWSQWCDFKQLWNWTCESLVGGFVRITFYHPTFFDLFWTYLWLKQVWISLTLKMSPYMWWLRCTTVAWTLKAECSPALFHWSFRLRMTYHWRLQQHTSMLMTKDVRDCSTKEWEKSLNWSCNLWLKPLLQRLWYPTADILPGVPSGETKPIDPWSNNLMTRSTAEVQTRCLLILLGFLSTQRLKFWQLKQVTGDNFKASHTPKILITVFSLISSILEVSDIAHMTKNRSIANIQCILSK